MIFCNDDEAIAFAGTENLNEAIEFYKNKKYMIAITKGSEGSVVIKDGNEVCYGNSTIYLWYVC